MSNQASDMKQPDDNDLAIAGTLPEHPAEGTRVISDGPRVMTVRDLLRGALKHATTPRQKRSCTTGSKRLDIVTGGMRPGITWVVMGLTSWGKSAWVVSCADENLKRGARVLIVSTEDSPEIYGNRLLARRAGIDALHVRDGELDATEQRLAQEVVARAEALPVYLDAIGKPAEWILEQLPKLVRAYGIDVVFIDYIQEIWSTSKHEDRRLQLAWIARELRATMKGLHITGAIMSQITPKQGEVPTKNDIRDSKDIVNGAEIVAVGHEPTKQLETKSAGTIEAGTKCLIIDKNKDGPKGVVPLVWDERSACFRDEPDDSYEGITDIHDRLDDFTDLDAPAPEPEQERCP